MEQDNILDRLDLLITEVENADKQRKKQKRDTTDLKKEQKAIREDLTKDRLERDKRLVDVLEVKLKQPKLRAGKKPYNPEPTDKIQTELLIGVRELLEDSNKHIKGLVNKSKTDKPTVVQTKALAVEAVDVDKKILDTMMDVKDLLSKQLRIQQKQASRIDEYRQASKKPGMTRQQLLASMGLAGMGANNNNGGGEGGGSLLDGFFGGGGGDKNKPNPRNRVPGAGNKPNRMPGGGTQGSLMDRLRNQANRARTGGSDLLQRLRGMNLGQRAGNFTSGVGQRLSTAAQGLRNVRGGRAGLIAGAGAAALGGAAYLANKLGGEGNNTGSWLSDMFTGTVAEKYESRGDVGTVSSGRGDAGGVSYGKYQLSSTRGKIQDFLRSPEGQKYAASFEGMQAGTAGFNNAYKQVAAQDPEGLAQAQKAYIARTNVQPLVNKVQRETGLNVEGRSRALKELFFSTATQYGPGTSVITKALEGMDPNSMSDSDLINRIQQYKNQTTDSYFRSSSDQVRASVANRALNEQKDLQSVLMAEQSMSTPAGTPTQDRVPASAVSAIEPEVLTGYTDSGPTPTVAQATPVTQSTADSGMSTAMMLGTAALPLGLGAGMFTVNRTRPTPAPVVPTTPRVNLAPAARGVGVGVAEGTAAASARTAGRAIPGVNVALGALDAGMVLTDENTTAGDKALGVAKVAGGIAGAELGASAGATAGAAIGSIVPGAGTAVGGVVGGLIGGGLGYWGGSELVDSVGGFAKSLVSDEDEPTDINGKPVTPSTEEPGFFSNVWDSVKVSTADTYDKAKQAVTSISLSDVAKNAAVAMPILAPVVGGMALASPKAAEASTVRPVVPSVSPATPTMLAPLAVPTVSAIATDPMNPNNTRRRTDVPEMLRAPTVIPSVAASTLTSAALGTGTSNRNPVLTNTGRSYSSPVGATLATSALPTAPSIPTTQSTLPASTGIGTTGIGTTGIGTTGIGAGTVTNITNIYNNGDTSTSSTQTFTGEKAVEVADAYKKPLPVISQTMAYKLGAVPTTSFAARNAYDAGAKSTTATGGLNLSNREQFDSVSKTPVTTSVDRNSMVTEYNSLVQRKKTTGITIEENKRLKYLEQQIGATGSNTTQNLAMQSTRTNLSAREQYDAGGSGFTSQTISGPRTQKPSGMTMSSITNMLAKGVGLYGTARGIANRAESGYYKSDYFKDRALDMGARSVANMTGTSDLYAGGKDLMRTASSAERMVDRVKQGNISQYDVYSASRMAQGTMNTIGQAADIFKSSPTSVDTNIGYEPVKTVMNMQAPSTPGVGTEPSNMAQPRFNKSIDRQSSSAKPTFSDFGQTVIDTGFHLLQSGMF